MFSRSSDHYIFIYMEKSVEVFKSESDVILTRSELPRNSTCVYFGESIYSIFQYVGRNTVRVQKVDHVSLKVHLVPRMKGLSNFWNSWPHTSNNSWNSWPNTSNNS
ncbi:hypothetical protein ACB098_06G133800 [Castanea mollissima]